MRWGLFYSLGGKQAEGLLDNNYYYSHINDLKKNNWNIPFLVSFGKDYNWSWEGLVGSLIYVNTYDCVGLVHSSA